MKLSTRLKVTFAAISVLPMVLFAIAFFIICKVMVYLERLENVTSVTSTMPKGLFWTLWITIFVILLLIATVVTRWIGRSVFSPISDLKIGMQQIAEGNFEYVLDADEAPTGEIAELYKNYEDMRLRLKESADEAIQNEAKNRELITNISHDLKTPITAIKGYV
ncbi:MAG: HAMP domain-containing histidine kinase, partial [Lachnospiraceae bacterium]|nr:HAMP domain-containing histidine kinase [Lachnospiraceae bacterium]